MTDQTGGRIRRGIADLPVPRDPGFDAIGARSDRDTGGLVWKLALAALLAIVLVVPRLAGMRDVASRPSPDAITVVDDFAGAALDTTRWRSSTSGVGPTVEATDGHLVMRIPADAHEDAGAPGLIAGSFVTRCLVRGDYDVQASFALLEWQHDLGVTLVLREAVPGSAGIMRGQIPGDVYETTIAHTPNTRTSDRSGTLRLVRSGQTVSSYYLRDGRWVRLASGEASTTDVAFELTLWTDDAARTGLRWRESGTSAPVAVALDDFRLTAATLVCP